MPLLRIKEQSIEEVFGYVKEYQQGIRQGTVKFGNMSVKLSSHRYEMFYKKGISCVVCGITGSFFGLERHVNKTIYKQFKTLPFDDFIQWEMQYRKSLRKSSEHGFWMNTYHWNLYALKEGEEVLMTKDHIIPKSKGGRNHLSNYQPMCQKCNQEKDDKLDLIINRGTV